MRKNVLYLIFILLAASCGNQSTENDHSVDGSEKNFLHFKFKEGQDFYVTLDWFETIKNLDSTQKIPVDTVKITSVYKYHVNSVDANGTAAVSITYDRMKSRKFDSDDSTTYQTREGMMYTAMKNFTFKASIDKTGFLSGLTGGDDFFTFGLKDSLVDDNRCIETDLNQFFHILPETKVSIGDSWTTQHTVNFGYPGVYTTTFTLREINNGIAVIELNSTMTENGDGLTVFPGGFQLQQFFKGTRTGVMRFNIETGMVDVSGYRDAFKGKVIGTVQNGKKFMRNIEVDLKKDFSVSDKRSQ